MFRRRLSCLCLNKFKTYFVTNSNGTTVRFFLITPKETTGKVEEHVEYQGTYRRRSQRSPTRENVRTKYKNAAVNANAFKSIIAKFVDGEIDRRRNERFKRIRAASNKTSSTISAGNVTRRVSLFIKINVLGI